VRTDPDRVAETWVHKRWWVSTRNLRIDLSNGMSEIPLTYETCVFDTHSEGWMDNLVVGRYPTAAAARRGHGRIVRQLKGGYIPEF
jgi:hypothetical protein